MQLNEQPLDLGTVSFLLLFLLLLFCREKCVCLLACTVSLHALRGLPGKTIQITCTIQRNPPLH